MSSPTSTANIALIICSTRNPRIGPSLAAWIQALNSSNPQPAAKLTTIDLADWKDLPISPNGAVVPQEQPASAPVYEEEIVNKWSDEIRKYQGLVFLTPQYNWSFPAPVKIAIDHLFHEWANKPALIISYGSRGGGKANAALREVLKGCRMNAWEGSVELPLGRAGLEDSVRGALNEKVLEAWKSAGKEGEIQSRLAELAVII